MSRSLPPFKFKKFSVAHSKCAMKIGVDGVLIGAWTESDNPKSILDIGTGSGLISLMMQQKFPDALITALEPNKLAHQEALDNFDTSPFPKKINLQLTDLQDFPQTNTYNIIISNPPFYEGNVSSGNENRDQARQSKYLPLEVFIKKSASLLAEDGILNFVYPTQQTDQILNFAKRSKLHLIKQTIVFPNTSKLSKRTLFSFSKTDSTSLKNQLFIKNSENEFTQQYIDLTKDFYINF